MRSTQVPEGYVFETQGRVSVLARADLAGAMESIGVFEASDPAEWKGVSGALAGGRGKPVCIRLPSGPSMVVKALFRGGVVSVFNRDLHGSRSRLFQEARLSNHLIRERVPFAPMLLGRAERRGGILFRLHLGSEEVEGAVNLLDLLRRRTGREDDLVPVFHAAGRTVRALHDAGVYHSDLNLGNLLAVVRGREDSAPRVSVIDLDRSVTTGSLSRKARAANLARLYRHAVKNGFAFRTDLDALWRNFLEGYTGTPGADAGLEREVARLYKRSFILHRLSWWIQGK